jgi:hypothetical protein
MSAVVSTLGQGGSGLWKHPMTLSVEDLVDRLLKEVRAFGGNVIVEFEKEHFDLGMQSNPNKTEAQNLKTALASLTDVDVQWKKTGGPNVFVIRAHRILLPMAPAERKVQFIYGPEDNNQEIEVVLPPNVTVGRVIQIVHDAAKEKGDFFGPSAVYVDDRPLGMDQIFPQDLLRVRLYPVSIDGQAGEPWDANAPTAPRLKVLPVQGIANRLLDVAKKYPGGVVVQFGDQRFELGNSVEPIVIAGLNLEEVLQNNLLVTVEGMWDFAGSRNVFEIHLPKRTGLVTGKIAAAA